MSKIMKLSDRTHVLKRPARYIGSTVPVEQERPYLEDHKIIFGNITYVPAFLKIIREIIDNSVDAINVTGMGNLVSISMDNKKIIVEDNSTGIPIKNIHDEHGNEINKLAPEAVWTELKTGSNFEDKAEDTQAGQNGEGSTLTNIFSSKFIGETWDGKKGFKLECRDNMEIIEANLLNNPTHKKGTKVTFWPDLENLNLGEEISSLYIDLVNFELLYLSITYPDIDFKFNGKLIKIKTARQLYSQYFDDNIIIEETDDIVIGISPSDDGYKFIHFINGLNVFNGGKVLDYAEDKILGALTDRIKKRIKDIKKSDIKNKVTFHCIIKNLPLPRFADQIKSESVNLPGQFPEQSKQILEIAKSRFIDKVYKSKDISGPIIDLFKAKKMLADKKDLERTVKKMKKPAKYWEARNKKYFVISEGDSAITSIINGVGRTDYGFYPIKGKNSNVIKDPKKLKTDHELLEISQILGIDFNNTEKELNYENIVIASDADVDGAHIIALLTGFFRVTTLDYFKQGKIYKLSTPLLIIYKKDKIEKFIFDFKELQEYEKSKKMTGYYYDYKKGLGSLSEEEWEELFKRYKFEDLLVQLKIKDDSDLISIDQWMNEDKQFRKNIIQQNITQFNINQI